MDKNWLLMTLLGLTLSAPLRGADAPSTKDADDQGKREETGKPSASEENKGSSKQVAKLASEFNVPEQQIKDLRARGLGWGEMRHALAIARKADVPLADVMKLRESGMGWGQIAQKYGFKLGDVAGKPREAAREGRRDDRDDPGLSARGRERGSEHRAAGRGPAGRGGGPRR